MYYVDENNKLYEKTGIDYRVSIGLQTLDGLTIATSDQVDSILNPKPTNSELFTAELDALNIECDKNIKYAVEKYSYAVAIDGSTETDKVASARSEITELNVQYGIDQTILINKYYGE